MHDRFARLLADSAEARRIGTLDALRDAPGAVAVRALDPADSGPALAAVAVLHEATTAEARDALRRIAREVAAARRRCRTPIEHCAAPFERLTTDR
jgi:hypothetical protein